MTLLDITKDLGYVPVPTSELIPMHNYNSWKFNVLFVHLWEMHTCRQTHTYIKSNKSFKEQRNTDYIFPTNKREKN